MLRFLGRRKAAAAVAILVMGLALGANTAAFAVVRAFLLASFALPEPDRLAVIVPIRDLPGRGSVNFQEAYPNYRLIRESQRAFSEVATMVQIVASWDVDGEVRPLQVARVTASFFPTTGVNPVLGRPFSEQDEGVATSPVAVISDALWRGAMGADAAVIGKTMVINGVGHTITGVMPPGFAHPLPTDVWLPFSLPAAQFNQVTGARMLTIYGRLRDGVTGAAAGAETERLTQRALEATPDNKEFRYSLQSFREFLLPGAGRTVLLVQGGALVLLLLAVLNLSSLLVAWGFERRREMAVRLVLGAHPGRIAGLLIGQSLVVVGLGGIAGLGFSGVAIQALRGLDVTQMLGVFLSQLSFDAGLLVISAGLALVAGVAAALLPVWLGRGIGLADALRDSSRGATLSPAAVRWQRGMVFAQATVSVVILSAATIVGTSFQKLLRVSNGFEAGSRIVARIQLDNTAYPDHAARAQFAARLVENLVAEPALSAAGFSTTLPVGDGLWGGRFRIELADGSLTPEPILLHIRRTSSNYLQTIGIPLLQGRPFDPHDDATHPPVAIVSRATAARLWPGQAAVGKKMHRVVAGSAEMVVTEVVGVAGNTQDAGSSAPPGEAVYLPYAQVSVNRLSIIVQPRGLTVDAIAAVRHAVRQTDPILAADGVVSLSALERQANALPRLRAMLLLAFGVVAIGIVALGSYGVMSQLVANREREFAIRLALGAAPVRLGSAVLADVARITVPGIVVGTIAVWLLKGALEPFVFGINQGSPVLAGAVGLAVAVLAAGAAVPPALRAARVDIRRIGDG